MGDIQSRNSLDKEAEINTRAGDKKRMKKIDKDIRKTFFFDKDMVASKIDFDSTKIDMFTLKSRCQNIFIVRKDGDGVLISSVNTFTPISSSGEKRLRDGSSDGATFQGD